MKKSCTLVVNKVSYTGVFHVETYLQMKGFQAEHLLSVKNRKQE